MIPLALAWSVCTQARFARRRQALVFILVECSTGQRYAVPAKAADKSTIRLLLSDFRAEAITACTDGVRAYNPSDEDAAFGRGYVVHGDSDPLPAESMSAPTRATGRPDATDLVADADGHPVEVTLDNRLRGVTDD